MHGPGRLARVPVMRTAIHPIPDVDLQDEVWTVEHIAAFLRKRVSAAYDRIREPGFPAPFDGGQRHRRWLAADVRHHFAQHRSHTGRLAAARPAVRSDAIVLRARKVAA